MVFWQRWRSKRADPGGMGAAGGGAVDGPEGRVLARGHGDGVQVAIRDDALAVDRGSGWQVTGWHLVQSGGWNVDTSTLEWTLADQTRDAVVLTKPGQVPAAFRERVNASIIVQQLYDVPGGGRVLIAGRRDLSRPQDPPVWQAVTTGRARLTDDATRRFVLEQTAALRADYEF